MIGDEEGARQRNAPSSSGSARPSTDWPSPSLQSSCPYRISFLTFILRTMDLHLLQVTVGPGWPNEKSSELNGVDSPMARLGRALDSCHVSCGCSFFFCCSQKGVGIQGGQMWVHGCCTLRCARNGVYPWYECNVAELYNRRTSPCLLNYCTFPRWTATFPAVGA